MFKIDVCKVCGVNCFWIECVDGDLAEKEVCSPECLAKLSVCPTQHALDGGTGSVLHGIYTEEGWITPQRGRKEGE